MRIRELLYSHSERYRVLSIHIDRSHLDTEHHDIAEATIARDTARAVDLLTEHIRLTARIILENDAKRSVSFFAGESAEDEKSLAGDPAAEDVFEGVRRPGRPSAWGAWAGPSSERDTILALALGFV